MNWKAATVASLVVAIAAVTWGAAQGAGRPALSPEDHMAIHELYATYARAYDTNEGDGKVWAETFTADGEFIYGERRAVGHKALTEYVNGRVRTGGAIQHWNANVIIRPTPEGARSSLYIMLVNAGADGKPPAIQVVTNYNDDLVKTPAGWRIKRRSAGPTIDPIRP